jgi:hypothetical protein
MIQGKTIERDYREQFGTELPNRWITLRATKLLKHMDKALVKIRGPAPADIVYT